MAACGAPEGGPPESQTKKPVRITYVLHNTNKKGVDEKHVPEYTKKNPHFTVEFSLVPDAELTYSPRSRTFARANASLTLLVWRDVTFFPVSG